MDIVLGVLIKHLLALLLYVPLSGQTQEDSGNRPVVIISTFDSSQGTGYWETLYDAVDLPELKFSDGHNWTGRIQSAITGPKARLVLYGDKFWKDRDYAILPSTRAETFEKLPWNQVESVRLSCVP